MKEGPCVAPEGCGEKNPHIRTRLAIGDLRPQTRMCAKELGTKVHNADASRLDPSHACFCGKEQGNLFPMIQQDASFLRFGRFGASFFCICLVGAALGACDDASSTGIEPEPTPGPVSPEPEPADQPPFTVETIPLTEVQPLNGRGLAVGVRSTGEWAVAYAVEGVDEVVCELFGGEQVERTTEVEVRVATGNAAFEATAVVDGIPSAAQQSIDIGNLSDGSLVIAYAGGEPANGYCGPSDLIVSTEAGGTFTAQTVATDSATATGCRNDENGPEGICQVGDTVGHYAAIAVSADDEVAVVFQDIHNGFAETDFSRADLELARGQGALAVESLSPGTGAGFHASVGFGPNNRIIAASETVGNNTFFDDDGNGYSIDAGIWVSVELDDGSYAETLIAEGGVTDTRVAVGHHPSAGFVVAFHDSIQNRLLIARSQTGEVDSFDISPVDQIGLVGSSPALSFMDDGRVVIAYRYCAGPGASSCESQVDGVRLAVETTNGWRTQTILGDDEDFEGISSDFAKGPNGTFAVVSHNTSKGFAVVHLLTAR